MAERASLPAFPPPPFANPIFERFHCQPGIISTDAKVGPKDPPTLSRRQSIAGKMVLECSDEKGPAYLLQRKTESTRNGGSVRVAYLVERAAKGTWKRVEDATDTVFSVLILPKESDTESEPIRGLRALQMLNDKSNVVASAMLGEDDDQYYAVLPFHNSTLWDYVSEFGCMIEADARYFFHQILKGLESLHDCNLCHRGLTMGNVLISETECRLGRWETALRLPVNDGRVHMLKAQPASVDSNPQYLAPELLRDEPFDGAATDLWAAGVMLLVMLIGEDAIFSTPLPEDPRFHEICVDHNLKSLVSRNKSSSALSEGVVDLIQSMLKAEPHDRLTLDEVMDNAWVKLGHSQDDVPANLKVVNRPFAAGN